MTDAPTQWFADPLKSTEVLPKTTPEERDWRSRAECLGMVHQGATNWLDLTQGPESTQFAKDICSGCVVRRQCLNLGLLIDRALLTVGVRSVGIWGGLTPGERRKINET